MVLSSYLFE